MNEPVNSTILLLDIEWFSDRDDVEQGYLRRMLYDLTDRALLAAGIDETRRRRADRGDSVMELIDAGASVTALLRALLTELPAQLRGVNRQASHSAQMRLRAVVSAGYVAVDQHDGWVGSDLNHACRLLDADLLKAALRARRDDFALCVSDTVYQGIVRHGHVGIPAEEFRSITVDSKNGPLPAWLHGPVPPLGSEAEKPAARGWAEPVVEPPPVSDVEGRSHNGGVFGGTNNGIAGGSFSGGSFTFGGGSDRADHR